LDVLSAAADRQTDAGTMSNTNRHTNLFLMIFFVDARERICNLLIRSIFTRQTPPEFSFGLVAAKQYTPTLLFLALETQFGA
jgi:hypothetical protein